MEPSSSEPLSIGQPARRPHTYYLRAIGMALCFAWAFCFLPPASPILGAWGSGDLAHIITRLAVTGALPAFLVPLLARGLAKERARAVTVLVGELVVAFSTVVTGSSVPPAASLAACFATGVANAFVLVLWGAELCGADAEEAEATFVDTFVLTGLLVIAYYFLPASARTVSLCAMAVLSAACFVVSSQQRTPGERGMPANPPDDKPCQAVAGQGAGKRGNRDLVALVARTLLAVTLISFSWAFFGAGAEGSGCPTLLVFGFGSVAAAVIIWLFTRLSPSVGFSASSRWTLPVMAIGIALCLYWPAVPLVVPCLLLAASHTGFETMLRMQAISLARQDSPTEALRTVGFGYASIMVGAFAGDALFVLISPPSPAFDPRLVASLLAVIVFLGVVVFPSGSMRVGMEKPGQSANVDAQSLPSGNLARAAALRDRYGLSPRETEVLGYLLEGRSRPYIRDKVGISISTVNTHVRHIYEKTGVSSREELIDLSIDLGISSTKTP